MPPRQPISVFDSHEVTNQPPPVADYNQFESDAVLRAALEREGAGWAADRLCAFGRLTGSEQVAELARAANRHPPELRLFDSAGSASTKSPITPPIMSSWASPKPTRFIPSPGPAAKAGGHVAHMALEYLLVQADPGVCCPITMTYAALPALRKSPAIARNGRRASPPPPTMRRFIPAAEKTGVTIGMAMTEKQGGSDVRTNSDQARPIGPGRRVRTHRPQMVLLGADVRCIPDPGADRRRTQLLPGAALATRRHAQSVSHPAPQGQARRPFQRFLRDRISPDLGAAHRRRRPWRAGPSSRWCTIRAWTRRLAAAGLMRQAVVQAVHHTSHRSAFGRLLFAAAADAKRSGRPGGRVGGGHHARRAGGAQLR